MKDIDVVYKGQVLTLTRFWADNRPCLWAKYPNQINMPKMEFVGGHPNEWCIFIDNLTANEKKLITDIDGVAFNIMTYLRENYEN